ncbi:hypothetical protein F5X96DRAFT_666322 [Biscogniauxia mediterranea]|nr:hypothetical protein F5X96DRAFT_666322 [Biscogniauxia mediterranea]
MAFLATDSSRPTTTIVPTHTHTHIPTPVPVPAPPPLLLHITLVDAHAAPLSNRPREQRRPPPPGPVSRRTPRPAFAEAPHPHSHLLGLAVPSSRPGFTKPRKLIDGMLSCRTYNTACASTMPYMPRALRPSSRPAPTARTTFPADDGANSYGRGQNGHITCCVGTACPPGPNQSA